jgi:RNA-directed DNA polymerase
MTDRSGATRIAREASVVVGCHGFGINRQKTSIAKNGGRKIVTGLSVEGDAVRLPRAYKDEIRQELFYLGKHGVENHCSRIGYKNHLLYLVRDRKPLHLNSSKGSGVFPRDEELLAAG